MKDKKVLIRRFFNQGDIYRLINSRMYLDNPNDLDNPYHRDNAEWGLLIQSIEHINDIHSPSDVYNMAREHDITVIPGFRIGMCQESNDIDMFTEAYWNNLLPLLDFCINNIDDSRRIIFDLENYPIETCEGDFEYRWNGLNTNEQGRLLEVSRIFMDKIRLHKIIPLFHPANEDIALGILLLKASDGEGVAQLETGDKGIIKQYINNYQAYQENIVKRYEVAKYWKNNYPKVLVANWSDETMLRKVLQPWTDVVFSTDNLVWIFDNYRKFDTTNNDYASRAHYEYDVIQDSNHHELKYVWQFSGYDKFLSKAKRTGTFMERLSKEAIFEGNDGLALVNYFSNWSDKQVTTRNGIYAKYPIKSNLENNNPVLVLGKHLIDGQFSVDIVNHVKEFNPWTTIITFSIDPFIYDNHGKNGWQQNNVLFSHWREDNRLEFFKLEIKYSELNNSYLELTVKLKGGNSKVCKLKVPTGITGKYEETRVLVSLGKDKITLALNLLEDDLLEVLPLEKEEVYINVNNTKDFYIPKEPLLGTAYNIEFTSCYIWSGERSHFPLIQETTGGEIFNDEWPFHSSN